MRLSFHSERVVFPSFHSLCITYSWQIKLNMIKHGLGRSLNYFLHISKQIRLQFQRIKSNWYTETAWVCCACECILCAMAHIIKLFVVLKSFLLQPVANSHQTGFRYFGAAGGYCWRDCGTIVIISSLMYCNFSHSTLSPNENDRGKKSLHLRLDILVQVIFLLCANFTVKQNIELIK